MTGVILQPGYIPWLGFFEQMYRSEVFVAYDDVQFDKGGWRNRNRIKTSQGELWLTVPIIRNFGQLVKEVKINNQTDWRSKHLKALELNYKKAKYFKDYFGEMEKVLARPWEYLIDLDMEFILILNKILGLEKKIVFSSTLNIGGDRIHRLINILRAVGADIFYEGEAGQNYINEEDFHRVGIKIVFQKYQHPVYPQLHGEFIPYLSVVDLIFNCGTESREIIIRNNA